MAEKTVTAKRAVVLAYLKAMARDNVELGLELWDTEATPACFERAMTIVKAAALVRLQIPDSIEVEVSNE